PRLARLSDIPLPRNLGPAFLGIALAFPHRRRASQGSVVRLDSIGSPHCQLGLSDRHPDGGYAGGRQHDLLARSHLFDRLYGPRSLSAALLLVSVALHIFYADAGDRR